jgi:CheY-like chemotaxis protein
MSLKKIMLVDDSPAFNFLSRTLLKQFKVECAVVEALNGKAALDYLSLNPEWPEVILLDLNMPVMDGFQFLDEFQKMEKNGRQTEIFVLTSSNRDEDKVRSTNYSAVSAYFDKPLSFSHVQTILAKVQGSNQ